MIEVKSPNDYNYTGTSVFLGGSLTIENDWRADFVEDLSDTNYILLNPRREDVETFQFDTEDPEFIAHVRWVNDALQDADIVVLYFCSTTESPVSLLDLADLLKYKKVYLCVDDNFWKRSLLVSAAIDFNVELYTNINDVIQQLRGTNHGI